MNEKLDRQAAFSGTRVVADHLQVDAARLAEWMTTHVDGFTGPLAVQQFRGGQSNPTYFLTARSGNYVLRRKPPGELLPSAHAVDREFRVQKALGAQGFPVARVHALETDPDVIGTMFYVMDHVAGRIFWNPHLPECDRPERPRIYASMNKTIADLHAIDPASAGLGDFGRPEGYVARQTRRWSEQYRASHNEEIIEMERLMEWLPEHLPPEPPARIVHGDYRLDNLILHAEDPEVIAVIDWELSTLGDPIADFTYHLMQWRMPPSPDGSGTGTLLGHDLAGLGIPALEEYAETYERRTGLSVLPHLPLYLAYNFFRMAAILAGVAGRARAGNAANDKALLMAGRVAPLAKTAWEFAALTKA